MDIYNPGKPLKKQLRMILDIALDRDYQKGLRIAREIVEAWESGEIPAKEAYLKLYRKIEDHDRNIERTYDITGSKYFITVAILLAQGVIFEDELSALPEEARELALTAKACLLGK